MKKLVSSAAVCSALTMMLAVPVFAENTNMNHGVAATSTTMNGTTTNGVDGFNRTTPDMYRAPGTTTTYSTLNMATNGTRSKAYAPGTTSYDTVRPYNVNGVRANAVDRNNNIDWGWLGLLGLIGLAGLRGRNRDRERT